MNVAVTLFGPSIVTWHEALGTPLASQAPLNRTCPNWLPAPAVIVTTVPASKSRVQDSPPPTEKLQPGRLGLKLTNP